MNCKPGDLAVIVDDDFPENLGKIVLVIAPASPVRCFDSDEDPDSSSLTEPGEVFVIEDAMLRPIRGNTATYEKLVARVLAAPRTEVMA